MYPLSKFLIEKKNRKKIPLAATAGASLLAGWLQPKASHHNTST
jgi:hypothetical protein